MSQISRLLVFSFALGLVSVARAGTAANQPVEIDNGRVKARFTASESGVRTEFLAKTGSEWRMVASSYLPTASSSVAGRLYDSSIDSDHRLIVNQVVATIGSPRREQARSSVTLGGSRRGQDVELTVSLEEGKPYAHVEFTAKLKGIPPKLEYMIFPLEVQFDGKPDFAHAPTFEPTADSVIGDRVFFSPAAIVQRNGMLVAVVPDLDLISQEKVYAKDARQQTHPKIFRSPGRPIKGPVASCTDCGCQNGYGQTDYRVRGDGLNCQSACLVSPRKPGCDNGARTLKRSGSVWV